MQQKVQYKNIKMLLDKLVVRGRNKAYRTLWNSLGIWWDLDELQKGGIWR